VKLIIRFTVYYAKGKIGEELGIKERAARFFLDQAKPIAAEYYNKFGR
jgi:hypothetical protein